MDNKIGENLDKRKIDLTINIKEFIKILFAFILITSIFPEGLLGDRAFGLEYRILMKIIKYKNKDNYSFNNIKNSSDTFPIVENNLLKNDGLEAENKQKRKYIFKISETINLTKNIDNIWKNYNNFCEIIKCKIALVIIIIFNIIYFIKKNIFLRREIENFMTKYQSKTKMLLKKIKFIQLKNNQKRITNFKGLIKLNKENMLINMNKRNKKDFNKVYILLIQFIITINLCILRSMCNQLSLFNYNFSKIKLNIRGIGEKNIFGTEEVFDNIYYPDEIIINGYNQNIINHSYYFNQTENSVELIWYNNINNCSKMFENCKFITDIDFYNFDSSNIKQMTQMFYNCTSLVSINLSNFDTSQVTDMSGLFLNCSSLKSVDLSNFNTLQVTTMRNMFYGCSSLISLNLSSFNTSQVTTMRSMFYGCSSIISLNLSSFNTSKVTSMQAMFYSCSSLSSINLYNFDTSQVTTIRSMFRACTSISSLNLSTFNTSIVIEMKSVFYQCYNLSYLIISSFDTSQVSTMNCMFYGCFSLTSLNIVNFDTSKVTTMEAMLYECFLLKSLNLSNFETSKVISMGWMFYNCASLTSLNLSKFNTSQTESIHCMFHNCSSLTSLDLSNFDTSKVTIMGCLFL